MNESDLTVTEKLDLRILNSIQRLETLRRLMTSEDPNVRRWAQNVAHDVTDKINESLRKIP